VCKIRHFADIKILRSIYFSLFHSHLQYCIIDWGRAYKTVIRPVQVLQNRILKYMTFSKRTSSASNIFKLLKILKVSDLYQLNLEKLIYKYNADILPSSFDNFFSKLYNSGSQPGVLGPPGVRNRMFRGPKCDFSGWEFVCPWMNISSNEPIFMKTCKYYYSKK